MSRTILKTPSSQDRGSTSWSSWVNTFTKFTIDVYIVEYSVTGVGIKRRKSTCISGTLANDNNARIPVHDGIMSMYFLFIKWKILTATQNKLYSRRIVDYI